MTNTDAEPLQKLRALVLAVLMVGSVVFGTVAFTGAAAAANASLDAGNTGIAAPTNVGEGTINEFQVDVRADNVDTSDGNNANITLDLPSSNFVFNSSTQVTGVTVNSGDVSESSTTIDTNNADAFVNLSDDSGSVDQTINVTFNVTNVDTLSVGSDATGLTADSDQIVLDADTGVAGTNDSISGTSLTVRDEVTDGVTESTGDATKEAANVVITITDGDRVNESTIDVYADNTVTSTTADNVTLVRNGSIVTANATVTGNSNISDDTNSRVERINVTSQLKEGDYDLYVSAEDTRGNSRSKQFTSTPFTVDMAGKALRLVADDSNPFANTDSTVSADEAADMRLTVVDQFGNNLTNSADGNVNLSTGDSDLQVSSSDGSITVQDIYNSETGTPPSPASGTPTEDSPFFVNITDSEAEDVTINIFDTGQNGETLTSGSATQTFNPQIGGIDASINRTQLPADGSSEAEVRVQLTDGNGTDVSRSGVTMSYSITNSSKASTNTNDKTSTNSSGIATIDITAQNSGFTLDITAFEQQTANAYSDSASIDTVAGDVSTSKSEFEINPPNSQPNDATAKVATDHTLFVDLEDAQGNAITGFDATLSVNQSGASLGSTTLTTNSSGQAETTLTLPDTKSTTQVNLTAGDYNASATGDAKINVTAIAENVSTLAFDSSAPTSVAPNSQDNNVQINAEDQFGNVNESETGTVTLSSDDTSVVDFDGSSSNSQSFSSGSVTFNVDANGTGTATLSATIPDANVTNVSQDITVANPAGIEVTVNHNVASSSVSEQNTRNKATLTAQFVDSNGDNLEIANEGISFGQQSGSAAELNQSLSDFSVQTGSTGNATIGINGTSSTGTTDFLAIADNFSVQGSVQVQTTGATDRVNVSPAASTVTQGSSTTVTATFVDSQDRIVPRTQSISLSTGLGNFTSSSNTTTFNAAGRAVATYNYTAPSGSTGTATVTAVGGGVTGDANVTVQALTPDFQVSNVSPDGASVTVGDNITVTADVNNTGTVSDTQTVEFRLDTDQNGTLEADEELANTTVSLNASENTTVTFSNISTAGVTAGTYTHGVVSENDTATANITLQSQATASASVTFDDTTVTNGTETVTVDSADYTLANGSAGDYVVVVHVVRQNGTISSPVGTSTDLTGSASNVTVDLNASGVQGNLDALTSNVTLQAMLHEQSSSSAFGSALMINGSKVTDDADVTVTSQVFTQPIPGASGQGPPTNLDNDPQLEDVNGDGQGTFDDAIALAFAQTGNLNQQQIDALDFDGDGDVDFDDAIALAFDSAII